MSMLSNSTASRLIAALVDRDPLGLSRPESIREGCKCEHCRWQRGLITGVEEPAPVGPGVPFGWLARTPDAPRPSNDMAIFTPYGPSQRAYDSFQRGDMAGFVVDMEQSWSAAFPLVPNPYADPWGR